jgi:thiol-disulfide isomerase/thioredoxin
MRKTNSFSTFIGLFSLYLLLLPGSAQAAESFSLAVHDQDIRVSRYQASGSQLMIWIMPRLSATPRAQSLADAIARLGIEVWLVDLADSLFLPEGPATQRRIPGRYVSGLVRAAHEQSGKIISLMAGGYAAIPVLKGARDWQLSQQALTPGEEYFSGVVLLSPELYATIPALGQDPVYEAIVRATNVPVMLFQSGKHGNRWQLDRLLEQLQSGGAATFHKILPGVIGLFREDDTAPATLQALKAFPAELARSLKLLQRLPLPPEPAALEEAADNPGRGLDTRLTEFRADFGPVPVDLFAARGQRVTREHYRGRVTVVNFWASWCPPCVEEIPSLNHLRELMAGEPFELISVNYAEDSTRVRRFLREVKVDFPVLLDSDGRFSAQWKVLVFPSTFVIGPDGRIVYGVNGAIHWDSPEVVAQLKALLKQSRLRRISTQVAMGSW